MAAGGVGYFATGFWNLNFWHVDYWPEEGGVIIVGDVQAFVGVLTINAAVDGVLIVNQVVVGVFGIQASDGVLD